MFRAGQYPRKPAHSIVPQAQGRKGSGARTLATCRTNRALSPRQLVRSEEHTSELQSLMRISYAVFCLKKKIRLIVNIPYSAGRQQGQHHKSERKPLRRISYSDFGLNKTTR